MIFWILNFISFQFNWQLTQQHLQYSNTYFSQKQPDLAGKMTCGWSTGFCWKIMTSSGPAFGQSGLAAPTGFSHIRLTALNLFPLLTETVKPLKKIRIWFIWMDRAGGRTGQAGAGCLSGPSGLGGKILKYLYLWNLKHFQHGLSMESHLWSLSTHVTFYLEFVNLFKLYFFCQLILQF